MHVSNSDLLDWRLRLHMGENAPIEFQLAVVEALLRDQGIVAGSSCEDLPLTVMTLDQKESFGEEQYDAGYDDGYRDGKKEADDDL